ncbi:MAG: PHP domain-containing protein [Deltaproteobacteria bacterium]|nr:PHP domain-containing protein [Deltaproteobacteria bacterium]MBI3077491.1 PHP domain-containing protein [Deltaproteobacteria bacterium]
MTLKADFHLHTSEDPRDRVRYSARELIDRAAAEGYQVLAITCHDAVVYDEPLRAYAAARGIVLIPGVEATIQGCHVVLLNMPGYRAGTFPSLAALREHKPDGVVAIAAHPFFPRSHCLRTLLAPYLDVFDAIEYCHFYTGQINFNRPAVELARREGRPLVGTSDAHVLRQFGLTYTLVDAEPTLEAVLRAIRGGQVEVVSRTLNLLECARIYTGVSLAGLSGWPRWRPRQRQGATG